MKLCIPTMDNGGLDDVVCDHFGRAPTFTVVDTETNEVQVVKNRSEHMGGLGKPPEHIAKTGAKVLICSGLGPMAIDMLVGFGVEVYVGAAGTAKEAIEAWKEGKLTAASHDVACKGHAH
ncbi:MAG TPA: NifB/NifX family molybdenum-iron cluster-binding protein [Thermoplasmata archaeon]|nr:NifB/NifX family molybdenum-iron cluster-binding protein [Thermoplasmata archaeon]